MNIQPYVCIGDGWNLGESLQPNTFILRRMDLARLMDVVRDIRCQSLDHGGPGISTVLSSQRTGIQFCRGEPWRHGHSRLMNTVAGITK